MDILLFLDNKIPERYKDAFGYQVDFVINQLSNFLSAITAECNSCL